MLSLAELPAFKPYALFSVLLVLKMGAIAFVTARTRAKSGVVVNPEDTKVNPGSHAEPQEAPAVLRAKRAHLNDLENIPGFLILGLLFMLSGGSALAAWSYFGFYFAVRLLHTLFYLNESQPGRTIMFFLGQLAQLGLMAQILMKAFK